MCAGVGRWSQESLKQQKSSDRRTGLKQACGLWHYDGWQTLTDRQKPNDDNDHSKLALCSCVKQQPVLAPA